MNILYVITRSERGGAQSHLLSLLEQAAKRHQVVLAVGAADVSEGNDFLVSRASELGIPVHVLPSLVTSLSPLKDIRATLELLRVIRETRPDLLHLHSSKAGLLGRVAGRLWGVPSVFTAHGWAFTDGVSPVRKAIAVLSERAVAPLTARIIAVSQYDANLARRWGVGRAGQVLALENGIPDLALQRRERDAGEPLRVAMTARFAVPKDQQQLICGAAQVPGVELWLIGDGPLLPEAQALAQQLGVSERVQFLGSRSDVPELLAQADVFALISNYEGFPMSTLEAMRAGLPVIVSDVGGAGEAVMPGVTGFVVPKGDVPELARVLQLLAGDPGRRAAMGEASRARFVSRYRLEGMLERTFAVYEDVLSGRKRGSE